MCPGARLVPRLALVLENLSGTNMLSKPKSSILLGAGLATLAAGAAVYYNSRTARNHVHTEGSDRKVKLIAMYLAGVGSGLAAVGAFYLYRRLSLPNPNYALKSVLPTLRANSEVRTIIGSNLQPGLFRAYSVVGSHPHTLQVMFQVFGERSSAMVTLQAPPQSRRTPIQCKTLIVDFANGERLILKGSADHVVFQGYTPLS